MQSLVTAFKYLTIWGRLTTRASAPKAIGNAAVYFPLVGLVIGAMLASVNYLLAVQLDSAILSILLIMLLLIVTGTIHLEGTKKTFDAIRPSTAQASHRANEFLGLVAIVIVILFKVHAVEILDDKIFASLMLTPALARWALVVFVYGYHDRCEATPRLIAENVKLWHLLLTTLTTLGLATYLLGRKGLWIGLSLSVFALLTRTLLHRRHAVLTHDNFGAVIELSETLSLVLLATL
jgi:adenosylcobinamide-GDP ribazoletransferase